jgi:hypothetical protein
MVLLSSSEEVQVRGAMMRKEKEVARRPMARGFIVGTSFLIATDEIPVRFSYHPLIIVRGLQSLHLKPSWQTPGTTRPFFHSAGDLHARQYYQQDEHH